MTRTWLSALAMVWMLPAVACDDKTADTGDVTPVRQGDIGAVAFSYACSGPGDVQCNRDSELAPVPANSTFPVIGAGTTFLVTTKLSGSDPPPNGAVMAGGAGSTFFGVTTTGDRTVVSALKEGKGALLALSGSEVLDLTAIEVHAIDHLKLLQASPEGDFKNGTISLGKDGVTAAANVQFTFKFRVVPVDKDGTVLAGALPVTWSSMDPNVVKLTSAANDNLATFVSGASGKTTVHVVVGTMSADVNITVGS